MTTIGTYLKAASEVLDYTLNYADVLSSETISTSTWAVAPSTITVSSSSNTTTTATVWLSGGTAGQVYTVTNTVVTSGGRTFQRAIVVRVGPRAGMVNLVNKLRGMCAAGTADYTLAGLAYWNDGQLQDELDKTRSQYYFHYLTPITSFVDSTTQWKTFRIPPNYGMDYEENASDAGWEVRDGTGAAIGTANYTVNYQAGIIEFTSDQQGADRYLDFRVYNLNEAASNVWRQKAAHVAAGVDWQSDNHRVSASQEYDHCLKMAAHYAGQVGMKASILFRTDEQ